MIREVDPSVDSKLHITGNPRMDLLRPSFRDLVESEAAGLRDQYGRFILLNGNFGSYNHAMGIDYTWKSIESKGWASTPKDKDFHHRRVELQGRFFKAFHSVLPKIATEERKVVVRPHPSESLVPWEELSEAHPGKIIVAREKRHPLATSVRSRSPQWLYNRCRGIFSGPSGNRLPPRKKPRIGNRIAKSH